MLDEYLFVLSSHPLQPFSFFVFVLSAWLTYFLQGWLPFCSVGEHLGCQAFFLNKMGMSHTDKPCCLWGLLTHLFTGLILEQREASYLTISGDLGRCAIGNRCCIWIFIPVHPCAGQQFQFIRVGPIPAGFYPDARHLPKQGMKNHRASMRSDISHHPRVTTAQTSPGTVASCGSSGGGRQPGTGSLSLPIAP